MKDKITYWLKGLPLTALLLICGWYGGEALMSSLHLYPIPQAHAQTVINGSRNVRGPIFTAPYGINQQSGTSYAMASTDWNKLVEFTNSGAVAVSIAQAGTAGFLTGWYAAVTCVSVAASGCTITPATSTINGLASISIGAAQGATIISDGTNYAALISKATPSSGTGGGISARGVIASLPPCGTGNIGFIYFGTDNSTANQCNGSSFLAFNFEPSNDKIRSFGAGFDGGGSALVAGKTAYTTIPFGCAIVAWNIAVDAGTATIDIWKIATGTAIPTIANTITAAALPAIATGTAIHSTTLTGWTTAVTANDIAAFNINTVSGATVINIVVQCNTP